MTSIKLIAALVTSFLLLCFGGCTDKPMLYKQGEYHGKLDSQPWNNAQFKGERVEWEKALKARSQGQDEYSRAAASAR